MRNSTTKLMKEKIQFWLFLIVALGAAVSLITMNKIPGMTLGYIAHEETDFTEEETELTFSFPLGPPDIIALSAKFTKTLGGQAITIAKVGEPIFVSVEVKNQGQGPLQTGAGFYTSAFINEKSASTPNFPVNILYTTEMPRLQTEQVHTISAAVVTGTTEAPVQVNFPEAKTYCLNVNVDSTGLIIESPPQTNEDNNDDLVCVGEILVEAVVEATPTPTPTPTATPEPTATPTPVPTEAPSSTSTPSPTPPAMTFEVCANEKLNECTDLCGDGMTRQIMKCNANCLKLGTKQCRQFPRATT